MNTTLTILSIWTIAASGIQLGTLWIMKLSILPLLNALPYDRYVNTCQLIKMHVFHPIAVWSGIIAGSLGVIAAIIAPNPAALVLFLVGSLGMLGVGLTSEGVNRPIWRQVEKWSVDKVSDERWAHKRHVWYLAHETRTYFGILAVAAYVAAVATV